jgi:hypothetical protein
VRAQNHLHGMSSPDNAFTFRASDPRLLGAGLHPLHVRLVGCWHATATCCGVP